MRRRAALVASLLCASMLLGSCGLEEALEQLNRSTVVFYKPVAYCQGLFHPEGRNEIDGKPYYGDVALIYKLTYLRNGQPGVETVDPSDFYVRRGYPWGGQTGPRLTDLQSVMVSSGETKTNVGVIGLPIGQDTTRNQDIFEPHRDEQGELDGRLRVHFSYLPLIFDPGRDGDTRGYVALNVGSSSLLARQWPCEADEIAARAARL